MKKRKKNRNPGIKVVWRIPMLNSEIENLRKKLDTLIDMNVEYNRIYEASVQLDRLIVKYYTLRYNNRSYK